MGSLARSEGERSNEPYLRRSGEDDWTQGREGRSPETVALMVGAWLLLDVLFVVVAAIFVT